MNIVIAGYGYVGKAYNKIFDDALIYDKFNLEVNTADLRNKFDMCLVSVPTPMGEDGSCDTSAVEEIFATVKANIYLIKSTVKPGTTDRLKKQYPDKRIVFSPEFVGEGGYFIPYWKYPHVNNPKYHDFQIFGGDKKDTNFMASLFLRRVGPHIRTYQTTAKTAEVIKYTENMFIATKVTFVNEMYEVCKAMGVTWEDVREGWLLDTRVSRMFSAVFQDKRGWGGKCLPKDTNALVKSAEEHGFDAEFLKDVLKANDRHNKL